MSTGYVALTITLMVIAAIVLVVAAFYDRRRAREIARDPDRLPRELHPEARSRHPDDEVPRPPGP